MKPTSHLTRRRFAAAAIAPMVAGPACAAAFVAPPLRLPPGERPSVALTLDACPGGFDERLARVLVAHAIPATIFVTGLWMRRNAEAVALLLAHRDLFSLQNHGDRHLPPILGQQTVYGLPVAGTADAVRTEITDGARAIVNASAVAPRWYRGAAALYSPEVIPPIREMGYGIAGYSLNADMGATLPAAAVAARIAGARDRDVIIGHINQPLRPSGAGIAAGVVALQQQGMTFVILPDQIAI